MKTPKVLNFVWVGDEYNKMRLISFAKNELGRV